MPQQLQRDMPPVNDGEVLWWIRICHWLWKLAGFLGTSVILALVVNVASTWLTTSKGTLPGNAPLNLLMTYWPITLLIGCCLLLLALVFWAISHQKTIRFLSPAQPAFEKKGSLLLGKITSQDHFIAMQL